jgi:hypothetical protein
MILVMNKIIRYVLEGTSLQMQFVKNPPLRSSAEIQIRIPE